MNTMILLGAIATLFIGLVAWILAGRTLRPTQQAWEKQQLFVANASHELRTPLTLIRAGTEVAYRNAGTLEEKQILGDVLTDTDHMNHLIEELLLLSRLDARALDMEIQHLNLSELLPDLLRPLERAAELQGVSLTSQIQNVQVFADPARIKQILLIVVDNALRHTPEGGQIFIETSSSEKFGQITVSDTGPGIPDEHIERVFDRFFKGKPRSVKENEGSGLGLSIAKSLMEAQKGTISIRNKSPHGVQVELAFPIGTTQT